MTFIYDVKLESKHRVNLSEYASLIIKDDIRNFYSLSDKEIPNEFFNTIFINFYKEANASISRRLDDKKQELEDLYSNTKLDKKTISDLIKKQQNKERESLLNKIYKYGKSSYQPIIRLNTLSKTIIKDCSEDEHYLSIPSYLKAIYEEYALLPAYERERIFFYDKYKTIDDTIKLNAQVTDESKRQCLKVTLAEKHQENNTKKARVFFVSPYKILPNITNSYNYLVGCALEKDSKLTKKDSTINSFRISNITDIRTESTTPSNHPGYISKEKQNEIESLIKERRVDFITGDTIKVVVRFSNKGLDYLKRQIYMRPNNYEIIDDNKNIYAFNCTKLQAISYFFKFGWDVEILEPLELRKDFIYRYESALKTYQGISREQIRKERTK